MLFLSPFFRFKLNLLLIPDEELADGSGEFLNVWLSLIEKLINVKLITETTHALPSTPSPTHKPFDPIVFLSKSHKVNIIKIMSTNANI